MTLVLGIESSCDETAAAVVEDGSLVRSNVIASQHELHEEYGGVVPEIASRAHVERILPVLHAALDEARVTLREIDAVAVGNRPGLIGSLLVGVASAKALAWSLGVPLLGIDHVHAHLYSGFLSSGSSPERGAPPIDLGAAFPALGLVVSGGHTLLYDCKSPLELTRLGGTIDDAVGEAFDKAASILGIPHPGGPNVDRLAQQGNPRAHDFPKSRLAPDSLDFSFSGLKTSLLYRVRGFPGQSPAPPPPTAEQTRDLAASFQRAAVEVIVLKLERALAQTRGRGVSPVSLLVGGGVSANSLLRAELARWASKHGLGLAIPAMPYCMDNAAMLAGLAYHALRAGRHDGLDLVAQPTTAA